MSYSDFLAKVRHLDNLAAKWMMRHFYWTFFQFVLIVIFIFWFKDTFDLIDASTDVSSKSTIERLVLTQSINVSLITVLTILNSFWMLFMFNGFQGFRNLLKDIRDNTQRMRYRDYKDHNALPRREP